jgi:hypothetical protein
MTQLPPQANQATSISRFAKFFRGYGVGLSLVVATLPIVISNFDVIPVFTATKNSITIITSVTSYLLVGFIFSWRHLIARIYFPGRAIGKTRWAHINEIFTKYVFSLLPLALAICFIFLFLWFNLTLRASVQSLAYKNALEVTPDNTSPMLISEKLKDATTSGSTPARLDAFGVDELIRIDYQVGVTDKKVRTFSYAVHFPNEATILSILKNTPSIEVPSQDGMTLQFLFMFVFATTAFILMGLQEYLQGEIGLSDTELIRNPTLSTIKEDFYVEDLDGVVGIVEYCPASVEIEPIFTGPFCVHSRETPFPDKIDPKTGEVMSWAHWHKNPDKKGMSIKIKCPLKLHIQPKDLEKKFKEGGEKYVETQIERRRKLSTLTGEIPQEAV